MTSLLAAHGRFDCRRAGMRGRACSTRRDAGMHLGGEKGHLLTGGWPATCFRGGGRRTSTAVSHGAGGGRRRARGGSVAHPEGVGEVAGAWGGRRWPGSSSPVAGHCRGRSQIRRPWVLPARASWQGRRGEHDGALGTRQRLPAARVRARGREKEKEQRRALKAGGRR